jgi:hypothetical protein
VISGKNGTITCVSVIREREQLAGVHVELRMRGETHRIELAAVVVITARLERDRIHFDRQRVFLQHEEALAVPHDVRVRGAAVLAHDARVVRVAIAVAPEQRAPRRLLQFEALVPHPAAAVVDVAMVEVKAMDHALAVDEHVIGCHRRVLPVRAAAIEGAVQVFRHGAAQHFEIVRIGLDA